MMGMLGIVMICVSLLDHIHVAHSERVLTHHLQIRLRRALLKLSDLVSIF
jgi:hypothetical protein